MTELSKLITSSSVGCLDGSQSKAINCDKRVIQRRLLICCCGGSLRLSAVRVRRGREEERERKNKKNLQSFAVELPEQRKFDNI